MSLDEMIREHYAGKAMSPERLSTVMAPQPEPRMRFVAWGAVAAAALLGIGVLMTMSNQSPNGLPEAPVMSKPPKSEPKRSTEFIVRSTPSGASVFVDDLLVGMTPVTLGDFEGPMITVQIRKDGYVPVTRSVILTEPPSVLKVTLVEVAGHDESRGGSCDGPPARLSVMVAENAGCTVEVGGKSVGTAPLLKKPVPSGRCEVVVACPDDVLRRRVLVIPPGSDKKIAFEPGQERMYLGDWSDEVFPEKRAHELYRQGVEMFRVGKMDTALSKLSQCVKIDRTSCLCRRALGIVHAKKGNAAAAAAGYRSYLEHCPDSTDQLEVRKLLEDYEKR